PADCYALDFEVEGKQSLAAPGQPPPTIQIAFQYTVACPCKADPAACIMQRRVRVLTTRVKASEQPLELMRHAATDASLALLLHKIMRAARSRVRGWVGLDLPASPLIGHTQSIPARLEA
ncbi:Sec23 sec24 transport family protein, partial [Haematococcus lacustris]